MCKYATYDQKGSLICEPNKNQCTMCVFGNQKTYNEIKDRENKVIKWQD